jgi:hypothetical protein
MNNNLYLDLLRQCECEEDRTILMLTASGVLSVSEEEVAVLGGDLSESEQDILQQAEVFFQKDAKADPPRWQVRSRGKIWVCAVNDTRLAHGETLLVKPGDRIDIGLLRFKVVTASEASLQQEEHETPVEKKAAELFDLGGLANAPKWNTASDEDNPFDIVGMHIPLLDEAQQPVPNFPGISGVEALSADVPEENILSHLANEYVQAILNPDHLHQQQCGESVPDLRHSLLSHENALSHGQEWEKNQSLEDFVSGKLTIQDILDRLGIDDSQQLEVSDPSDEDVLMLFAQDIQRQKQGERIPVRTRYDHHRVSLDSHYQPEESNDHSGNSQIDPNP